ncbi:phage Gp37/Gp68 family protein [Mesorhizobium sp. M8A.F.Ca.ET.208.01.1.1]|uniref:DUF5131 family protein n=1 Tax=unclassified Mesorhizobium TaxID=325217 RepID=UPI001093DEE0|nr:MULTISPECIES: phage Gp37/Gp68 family protein [unclassified Mesorhizobium]TGQ95374.1 phage Gp37/Gp68 family protein [Mesorhizobium sp. M8A.F.Ca.ET.208.01.1.1]TGT55865.1 phage Gp37/Gp68 family protein [Mesorhizobium sp. M8A.F.Ca.ET.167.01.1.1]
MADKSSIEWTDATWNPIVGCSVLSPGCTHCYAMKMAARIEAMGSAKQYAGTTKKVNGNTVWTGKLALAPEHILTQPLRWARPRRIFVNSMGDLFHEDVPDEWIDRVFAVMALAPQHTFQVLTKRARRMREYMTRWPDGAARIHHVKIAAIDMFFRSKIERKHWSTSDDDYQVVNKRISAALGMVGNWTTYTLRWPLPNVWLGVSAERQQEADLRIPDLLATPAAIRFVSAEPLLGPIDFTSICTGHYFIDALRGLKYHDAPDGVHGATEQCAKLDQIIVGGESGPDARPMYPQWPRWIRNDCSAAGTPFFFKQWGAWAPARLTDCYDTSRGRNGKPVAFLVAQDGTVHCFHETAGIEPQAMLLLGKKAAGRLLDGIEHNGMPETREVPAL